MKREVRAAADKELPQDHAPFDEGSTHSQSHETLEG